MWIFKHMCVPYFSNVPLKSRTLILTTIHNYFHSIFEPQIATPVLLAQNRFQHHTSQRRSATHAAAASSSEMSALSPPSTAAATRAVTTLKKQIAHTPAAATALKQRIAEL